MTAATLVEQLRACANGVGTMKTDRGDFGICTEAADEITRLTAALGERDGWRPIESAPRDGTRVLLYFPRQPLAGAPTSHWAEWTAVGEWQNHRGWGQGRLPTHWQPLPAAPAPQVTR